MNKYCFYCMEKVEDEKNCPKCGREVKINEENIPAHHLFPGALLNNRYRVGYALGEGGFGITYIGHDENLDMKVAIKEYYPNGYVNRNNTTSQQVKNSVTENRKDFFDKGKDRFLSEARILAKFSGEDGVVDVRDFFQENNTAYIIMEYLNGDDLKTYVKKQGLLSPEKAVDLLMPIMVTLKEIHAQGLIHRDISPDNIMVTGGKIKLLDFGAARNVSAGENKSLSVMLKPGYAPEEQYRSKGKQGPWTDVYALSATLYKCITGITPDDATQRVFSDEVKSLTALGIDAPYNIEKAIMTGMSVHQADRYKSIDELIAALNGEETLINVVEKTVGVDGEYIDDTKSTYAGENDDDSNEKTEMISENEKTEIIDIAEKNVMSDDDNKTELVDDAGKTEVVVNVEKRKKSKKPFFIILAAIIVGVVIFVLVNNGNRSNSDSLGELLSRTKSVTVKNADSVDYIEPENSVDVEKIYDRMHGLSALFYGKKLLEGMSAFDENDTKVINDYKDYMDYGDVKTINDVYLSNLPFGIVGGENDSMNSMYNADWLRLYYCNEKGAIITIFAKYILSDKDNTIHITPIKSYNVRNGVLYYDKADYSIDYKYEFDGMKLTLSYNDKSVTLVNNVKIPSTITGETFENGKQLDGNVKKITLSLKSVKSSDTIEGTVTIVDKDDKVYRDGMIEFKDNGLATICYSDGHDKNAKYYSQEVLWVFCGDNGFIMLDGDGFYNYAIK